MLGLHKSGRLGPRTNTVHGWRERVSNSRPPRRPVSLSLPSTMAKGPCLGSGGFHSHALDEGRKRERERERAKAYGKTRTGAIMRSLRRHGRLHNLLTPMENKSPCLPHTVKLSTFHEKCKQVVDHLGMSLDRVAADRVNYFSDWKNSSLKIFPSLRPALVSRNTINYYFIDFLFRSCRVL